MKKIGCVQHDCEKCQAQAAPYDQQALELCDKCGWKTVIPGEPCLMCEKQAAARGARIQTTNGFSKWLTIGPTTDSLIASPHTYSIHPEDEHLQYGPISTELRAAADTCVVWLQDSLSGYGKAAVDDYVSEVELGHAWHTAFEAPLLQKQLFLLLLAEVLSESGL